MITVKLQGGLGNQMFQYAFGKALSIKYNCELVFDRSFLESNQIKRSGFTPRKYELDKFNCEINYYEIRHSTKAKKWINFFYKSYIRNLILKNNIYLENQKLILNLNKLKLPAYFDGYWQSEQYFIEYKRQIHLSFQPKKALNIENIIEIEKINSVNSVSIHFRRGDYVDDIQTASVHGTCTLRYYENSIFHINKTIKNPYFFIFTDDPIWVKENFIEKNKTSNMSLVEINNGGESWKDIILMSKCKHNIIANSSFSWWGAWLNENENKIVVAPKQWFALPELNQAANNIIPKEWIKI